jgi:hypothetical protein
MSYQRTQSRNLVSQQNQSVVPANDVPRSRFLQQWNRKTTGNAGQLYPFCVLEVLPGDHVRLKAEPFVRTSTPLFPVMDTQRIDIHWFYCPLRILWDNFERFMGWQRVAGDSIAYTVPQVTSTGFGFAANGLGDHFGLPVVGQPTAGISASAFPFRMYEFIWEEMFRDQNLAFTMPSVAQMFGDAAVGEATFAIRPRAKSHDYFTSALVAPQKFTAPVVQSPVIGLGVETGVSTTAAGLSATETPSPAYPTGIRVYPHAYESTNDKFLLQAFAANGAPQLFSQTDIRTFRAAMLVQQYLEKDSRGGTRYVERNLNHFRVRSPDARLQRPEFIGGGSTPIVFTPVAQTATGGSGVGALGGAGSAVGTGTASYAAVEDGLIMGLWSVKTQLSYSQGLPRWASRLVRTDYYVPSLAQLSEQVVFTKEIYCTGVPANDDSVFGYQEPWQELRQRYSEVTGMFRPTTAANIAQWHLSQQFVGAPVLGPTFINDNPPMSRVMPTGASNLYYLVDINISADFTRPMPMFGVPAQLGRF